jgi:hypothetical protein
VTMNRAQLWIAVVGAIALVNLAHQLHGDGRPIPVLGFLGTMALIGALAYAFRDQTGVPEHVDRLPPARHRAVQWLSWVRRVAFAALIIPWLGRGLVTGYLPANSSGWVRALGMVFMVAMFAETYFHAGTLRPEETRGFARRHLTAWAGICLGFVGVALLVGTLAAAVAGHGAPFVLWSMALGLLGASAVLRWLSTGPSPPGGATS